MSYTICLLIFLAFAVTAQKYDLEQRSNKLFGKGLSQVLQEFRDSPEYLKILAQRVSNWKKSANMIFFSLFEDQTNKFIKDVENLDNVEISINARRNMEKNKTIFELLDGHSYAQFTSDEVSKLKNLAHEHFNMFLHSYMEALSPGLSNSSRDSLRSKHESQFLEIRKRLVLNKSQIPKIEVPKTSKHQMPGIQQKQSMYWQKELKEIPKPESPKIPRMKQKERLPEQKVPKEPEIPKLEVQKLPKQEMTRMERLYEQKVLKKPEIPKLEVPNINISRTQQKERIPEHEVVKKPEMPKLEVPKLLKQEMPRMEILYGQKLPKEVEAAKVPEMLKNKLQKQDGVSKQEILKELEKMQLKKALKDSIPNVTFT